MLLLLALWILASLIFISIGDFFTVLYNKFAKRNEDYGITDLLLLGMSLILLPLGITSIWLPSGIVMLVAYVVLATIYWLSMPNRAKMLLAKITENIKMLSAIQLVGIVGLVASFIMIASWTTYMYDAVNYHYQLTTWYENYHATPGLANIESRLGFNSNYLLISSLFSLQRFLGEPVYIIQLLFTAYFAIWIVLYIIKSNYELKGLLLMVLFCIFIGVNWIHFSISSTDILPSIIIFYLASNLIIYPNRFKDKYLLFFLVPLFILTIKLSVATFGILSLYITYLLVRDKDYRSLSFLLFLGCGIVFPWLIRNVIISGYLIYPLYEIDLFNVDWKAPELVAHLEKGYIKDFGWDAFKSTHTLEPYRFAAQFDGLLAKHKLNLVFAILTLLTTLASCVSLLVIGYKCFRKNKLNSIHKVVILALLLTILAWFSAPDFRFIAGVFYSVIFLGIVVVFKNNSCFEKLGKLMLMLLFLGLPSIAAKRTFNYYHEIKESRAERPFTSFLYKPYGVKAQKGIKQSNFDTYIMNDQVIFLSSEIGNATYDYIPCTFITQPVEDIKKTKKFYPLQGVEMRGSSLNDGFRPIADFDIQKWKREDNWWKKK